VLRDYRGCESVVDRSSIIQFALMATRQRPMSQCQWLLHHNHALTIHSIEYLYIAALAQLVECWKFWVRYQLAPILTFPRAFFSYHSNAGMVHST